MEKNIFELKIIFILRFYFIILKKIDEYEEEKAKQAGHQNHDQKIEYLLSLKRELNQKTEVYVQLTIISILNTNGSTDSK